MNDNQPSPWGHPPNDNDPQGPRQSKQKNSMKPFLLTVIGVVVFVFILAWVLSDGLSSGQSANLAYDFMLLALVGAGLLGHIISNPGQALRNVAGWVIIFGVMGLGYSIWNGKGRLASEINPANGEVDAGAITFRSDQSGHYYVRADINGKAINFMIDTGATHIVLKKADAEKIGFNIAGLKFDIPASTANGMVFSAPVLLETVSLGPIHVEKIEAYVNEGQLDISLLGMSFLNKLSGYEVRDGLLTLYP
ncbi:MAG: TIGR02281 family clan AA aspartic protease [Alphaproteobacteria bacterium]|nr:TIGR02281 family clan AA aspartic protease [Alphaproteobacteria bacterium]HPF47339.1 TIGR02281 family clan AA aspartic protease [Emcibacteraceae bacterium]HRW28417.1 TIGR02281 family clan AA aspartic protease [Emcibacteraceae bacterium]